MQRTLGLGSLVVKTAEQGPGRCLKRCWQSGELAWLGVQSWCPGKAWYMRWDRNTEGSCCFVQTQSQSCVCENSFAFLVHLVRRLNVLCHYFYECVGLQEVVISKVG